MDSYFGEMGHMEPPIPEWKAQSGLGPGPGWGPVRVGAHMGPVLFKKSLILMKKHKTINKNIEVVKLEI